MNKTALVTDSTADIPIELQEKYNIHIIPLSVIHGDVEYQEGIDITSENFYDLLNSSDIFPKSSQPSPKDFDDLYSKLLKDHDEVLSIHLSSGLSGTINAAFQSSKNFEDKVTVFDSESISLGIGLQVIEASKKIQEGWNTNEIVDFLSNIKDNIELLFTLDTLEYLYKGGRINKVSNLMGSLLDIKPIVTVKEGKFFPFGKARRQQSALSKIVTSFENFAKEKTPIKLAVAHGKGSKAAKQLKEMLEERIGIKAEIYSTIGPVVGVHTGPGTVGAAILYEE
ncbi:DegV family protein [Natranaerobius trueperi]|uniref:Fatty acid-binding protein DegV n=1 Tax=Natranaerobius trueperi TaxID=759412 RepID=A0A226C1B2_9FIRM|nr:DegV family protein [Natranaerobius trueperi]OWZ84404.1 fatty acid-binding protein DegV [Natranaerobius trueperi]